MTNTNTERTARTTVKRTNNSKSSWLTLLCLGLAMSLTTPSISLAQNKGQSKGQSKSQSKEEKPPEAAGTETAEPTADAAGGSEQKGSDRVDLNKLEEKYWSAKDDDFTVVQNRAYPKAKRWSGSLYYGKPFNDNYREGTMTGASLGYYFTERYGIELQYQNMDSDFSELSKQFNDSYKTYPNGNSFVSGTSVVFQFVPLYAKMSFLDKRIIYFDMSIGLVLGNTEYRIEQVEGGQSKSAFHFGLDVTQQFFISERFAFRFDFRNKWTNESRANYNLPSVLKPERSLGDKLINDTSLLFGLTYWH